MPQRGFSIVELLVVIAILGVLVVLLLPALQSSREAGRRMQCTNNMKQLATGCLGFEAARGALPPAMQVPTKGNEQDKDPGNTYKWGANWVITILPFCEYDGLYREFDLDKPISDPANAAARATLVPTMLCPSDSYNSKPYNPVRFKREGRNWARGNYGANGAIDYLSDYLDSKGRSTGNGKGPSFFLGPGSPGWNATGGTKAGSAAISRGVMGCNEACSMNQITDGSSHTVMLGELRAGTTPVDRRGTWAMGAAGASSLWGHGVCDDHGPNADDPTADDIKFGAEIAAAAGGEDVLAIQGMSCNTNRIESTQATARSQHAGGVNVVMCDVSAHFISNSIDHGSNHPPERHVPLDPRKLHVWERLNVSCDGQTVNDDTWQ